MHRLSDPQQPAGEPVRQGSAARGRWRNAERNAPNENGQRNYRNYPKDQKGPKVGVLRARIRTGRNYLNSSEFPTHGAGQRLETFVMFCQLVATIQPVVRCTFWPSSDASLAPSGPLGETLATWSVQVSD